MKAHRSWRSRCAYILAGESAMLLLLIFWFALFHALVGRAENVDVGRTEWKLGRLGGGGTGFDFVDPIEKLAQHHLIAAGGLGSELKRGRLHRGNPSLFPVNRRDDLLVGGLADQGAEVFRSFWPSRWITARALAKLWLLGRVTAADPLSGAFVFC